MRGGAVVARQAHNLKAVGSIPAPATNFYRGAKKLVHEIASPPVGMKWLTP